MASPKKRHNKQRNTKPSKEAFYVRIVASDGQMTFVDATSHIGKPMPFNKPRATLAMSVSPTTISFSLLHLTSKSAAKVKERPIEIPAGSMSRMNRRADLYRDLGNDELVVELSTRSDPPRDRRPDPSRPDSGSIEEAPSSTLDNLFASEQAPSNTLDNLFAAEEAPSSTLDNLFATEEAPSSTLDNRFTPDATADSGTERARRHHHNEVTSWRCHLRRTPDLLASVETVDDDHVFELPLHPIRATVYMKSPVTKRMLCIAFIGHVGKPGTPEAMSRVAAKVLASMSHLPEFNMLASIEGVDVGAAPGHVPAGSAAGKLGAAAFPVRMHLFDDSFQPVGSGNINVHVDLENANPSTGRLFYRFEPDPAVADMFPGYSHVLEAALHDTMRKEIGDDGVSMITCDIVLGSVTSETIGMLVDAGAAVSAIDATPTRWAKHT